MKRKISIRSLMRASLIVTELACKLRSLLRRKPLVETIFSSSFNDAEAFLSLLSHLQALISGYSVSNKLVVDLTLCRPPSVRSLDSNEILSDQ